MPERGLHKCSHAEKVISPCLLAVYRICPGLHPLARVPGPFLQRVSGLPRVWQCRKGNRHLQELAAHEKYGWSRSSFQSAWEFSSPTRSVR